MEAPLPLQIVFICVHIIICHQWHQFSHHLIQHFQFPLIIGIFIVVINFAVSWNTTKVFQEKLFERSYEWRPLVTKIVGKLYSDVDWRWHLDSFSRSLQLPTSIGSKCKAFSFFFWRSQLWLYKMNTGEKSDHQSVDLKWVQWARNSSAVARIQSQPNSRKLLQPNSSKNLAARYLKIFRSQA